MDQNGKDDLKTQFATREGTYRLITLSEYSRPNRVGYQSNQNNPQVRVSLLPAKANAADVVGKGATSAATSATNTATITSTNTTLTNSTNNTTKYLPHQSSSTTSTAASSSSTAVPTTTAPSTSTIDAAATTTTATPSVPAGAAVTTAIATTIANTTTTITPATNTTTTDSIPQYQLPQSSSDKICFNFGKELYIYSYRGVKKNVDLCKPIDKKLYKGTSPSCHVFNESAPLCECAPLLVGFTTGQIQLVQPGKRETGRLYNEERLIDKTKVTCLKWLPKSPNLFLASHSSGHLYLYNEELPCTPAAPNYQNFKSGDGYTILTCKSKSTRNPLYKWTFNTDNSSINEFCFSPCGSMLAIVSQDGFLRVFHYDTMELLGIARSYFGGFLCVCWSPDSKYIVVGGEDDLVTIWSMHERRVVARGQGHRSWVSVVAFDPYTSYSNCDSSDFSDDENMTASVPDKSNKQQLPNTFTSSAPADGSGNGSGSGSGSASASGSGSGSGSANGSANGATENNIPVSSRRSTRNSYRDSLSTEKIGTSYRLGSVGQDTQLCLWDITEDILRQSYEKRHRLGSHDPQPEPNHSGKEVKLTKLENRSQVLTDSNYNSKISNFCTKFSSSNSTTQNDSNSTSSSIGLASNISENNKHSNSFNKFSSNSGKATNVMENCVNTSGNNITKVDGTSAESGAGASAAAAVATVAATTPSTGTTAKSGSSKSESSMNAFNTLTQRLSNFNFVNDKKQSSSSQNSHKKAFTFSKSTGNHASFLHNNSNNSSNAGNSSTNRNHNKNGSDLNADASSSVKNSKNLNSIIPSYDPMKLIGSAACPRFDECPLLEPLVCKKIAHERLTALIFREDCFLTACQDGFIYTWARPGFSSLPQHNIANSPTGAPSSGTVV